MVGVRVGGRNNVVVTGRADGPTVLLAHGFGCDQNLWRRIAPDLAERSGWCCSTTPARAFGPVGLEPGALRHPDGYADDVLRPVP